MSIWVSSTFITARFNADFRRRSGLQASFHLGVNSKTPKSLNTTSPPSVLPVIVMESEPGPPSPGPSLSVSSPNSPPEPPVTKKLPVS